MEHFHGVYNYYGDDSDYSASSDEGESWLTILQRIKENDRYAQELDTDSYDYNSIDNMTDEGWEELGRDISNNTHLETVSLHEGALNNHKMRCFFRGLMKSSSIKEFHLHDNELSVSVVRSMVPFLQNADNLTYLDLDGNGIQTKGFNMLFRALRNRPIERLRCDRCEIDESIEIDNEHMPHNLKVLRLSGNGISTDGCRGLAKLLQGDNSTLRELWLSDNEIDDEGVEIMVDALQNNTSLETLNLRDNEISVEGMKACLRLVNDISSINATLQTNHTLTSLHVKEIPYVSLGINDEIQNHIDIATSTNRHYENKSEAAGRRKVIRNQLCSGTREKLATLQGVDHSVYSEIDPLHLPEVLSLIGQHHGHAELHWGLSSSIMTLFSTVNRKKCIQQQMEYHAAKAAEHRAQLEELGTELEAIEAAEGNAGNDEVEHRSNKRRRKWWWGLWGGV